MATPRMRPVFEHPMAVAPAAFYGALTRATGQQDAPCRASCFGEGAGAGAIVRIRAADQHVWSPALHLYVEQPGGDQPGVLHGRFSPSSPVWTAFIAIYLVLLCVGVASACYGGAQIILDDTPWAFVGVPIALALAAFTYGAAFIGQGLGAEDMFTLRSLVEELADGQSDGLSAGRDAASATAAAPEPRVV